MRNVALLSVGILLVLLQSNLYRVFAPIAELLNALVGGFLPNGWQNGSSPSLALPIVIFLGVQEPSMARGSIFAAAFGYAQDILGAAPLGLFTFVSVAIWWLARVAGVRLAAQTALTRMPLVLLFAVLEGAMILILLAIFGNDTRRPLEVASAVLPRAVTTALVSPLVFRLVQRLGAVGGVAGQSGGQAA
jgi:rod shape-determining protein MreD